MSRSEGPVLRIPESVREDTLAYRSHVEKFLRGEISPIAFRAYRVPMGIYEQRTAGKYMVRIRIGAGLVLPYQLERIAKLSKFHGNGILHITTRQDIQIHNVDIKDTPDVLERLLEVGLSPRGGGGNTVRNVTACPRAGVCPEEEFDVAPYAIATAEYLLQFNSSYNLPRKYKIIFSGCSRDCAFASVADLGFFAHRRNDSKGFAVYAGGGLGSNPAVAVKIEDFIKDTEFLEVAESIKRLFDKHGDRANKHKARLRYVLKRLGAEKFIAMYRNERVELQRHGLEGNIPILRDIALPFKSPVPPADSVDSECSDNPAVSQEKTEGLFTVIIRVPLGNISADDLTRIGKTADDFGAGLVRTTQLQDILITSVPSQNLKGALSALRELSFDSTGNRRPKMVVCAGASTCKLGLCLSRGLADAISSRLGQTNLSDMVIRISGCPNSCGHHYIADIGFQGKAKRMNGRLMPCYDVLVGAKMFEGDAYLAETIGTVPAKRIPDLLAEALSNGTVEKKLLKSLTAKYSKIGEKPLPDNYYYDWGSDEPFSLAGRGPGECGAGVMDVIRVDIDEARDAIKTLPVSNENVYKGIVAVARALLFTVGLEPKKDREIFAAFKQHLIEPGWVKPQTQQLLDNALDWRMGDVDSINDLFPQVEDLVNRVEELFLSLDANLKFRVKPAAKGNDICKTKTTNHIIDLRGVACPLNFVKAKLELEKLEIGDILNVLLDGGEPVRNAPASFAEQGQDVIEIEKRQSYYCVKVRRKK